MKRDMEAYLCERCARYWMSNAAENSLYITTYCPNCIPVISQRLDSAHPRHPRSA